VFQLQKRRNQHFLAFSGFPQLLPGVKRRGLRRRLTMAQPKQEDYAEIEEEENQEEGHKLPEDAGVSDYLLYPWKSLEGFFERFNRNFGWRFAVQMATMYALVKGLMMSVLGLIKLSYCKKSLGIDGTACQTMGTIASTPWAIKGAIGVLSDAYPLLGYHKASYIIVVAVMGTMAFIGLATLPITSAAIAAMLMFAANLEIATADLLCEGKYAELMQTKPKTGSTMVSSVWGCFQLGSLVAACFVGPVADHYDPKVLFWVLTPIAASIIIPTGLGYLADERVPDDQQVFKTDLIKQYPYIISFCLVMALCAIGESVRPPRQPVARHHGRSPAASSASSHSPLRALQLLKRSHGAQNPTGPLPTADAAGQRVWRG